MKRVAIVLGVIVVVLAAGLWWTIASLDRLIAAAIEDVGSDLLGTAVRVERVETDLREGRASLFGLSIANPTGEDLAFSDTPAFSLGEISVDLDLERLTDGPIPIQLVRVLAPSASAEVTRQGINLDVLRKRLAASGSSDAAAGPEAGGEATRLRIDRFEFEQGSLRVDSQALGGDVRTVELPSVRLTELEGTPSEIGRQVLDVYLGRAARAAGVGRLEAEAKERVQKELDKVEGKAGDALRSLLGGDR